MGDKSLRKFECLRIVDILTIQHTIASYTVYKSAFARTFS